jgi:hypothetical protein
MYNIAIRKNYFLAQSSVAKSLRRCSEQEFQNWKTLSEFHAGRTPSSPLDVPFKGFTRQSSLSPGIDGEFIFQKNKLC